VSLLTALRIVEPGEMSMQCMARKKPVAFAERVV
jgi:hypothetical protein